MLKSIIESQMIKNKGLYKSFNSKEIERIIELEAFFITEDGLKEDFLKNASSLYNEEISLFIDDTSRLGVKFDVDSYMKQRRAEEKNVEDIKHDIEDINWALYINHLVSFDENKEPITFKEFVENKLNDIKYLQLINGKHI